MSTLRLPVPEEFSFSLSLEFLQRSPRELLHRVDHDRVFKLLKVGAGLVLFSVREANGSLQIEILNGQPDARGKEFIKRYVSEWFDLSTDLKPFYAMAKKDPLLSRLTKRFKGYRIVGQPDLFESLVWAVLGQQINLGFAYTLKQRFVEQFGDHIIHNDQTYFLFPSAEKVSQLKADQLLALQFSRQKAAYTIGIAQAFVTNQISKQEIEGLSLSEAKEALIRIKGVGNWTANYALMKTFRHPDAFPLEDAGLHNAIKNQLGLRSKPELKRVKKIFEQYKGWEAYVTLYLWKSL